MMASPLLTDVGQAPVSGTRGGLYMVRNDSPVAIVGGSVAIQEVRALIRQVARTNASVLITGPSGTGKECDCSLMARCRE